MIKLTRMNGIEFFLNAELIKSIESTPDTVISMISSEKMMVKESREEVVSRIIEYKRKIFLNPLEEFVKTLTR